jgi:death-on-curing protein
VKAAPANYFHLTVEAVREIHAEVIASFGGSDGIRDLPLLESAVAAPQATFGGQSPYTDLVDLAAAYLFYLCRNHPFIDGNKRTALAASLVFLRLNGADPAPDGPKWEKLTLSVASSELDRAQTTTEFQKLIRKLREHCKRRRKISHPKTFL